MNQDVTTLDNILKTFYEVISGPAGQPRDWARDALLYVPGAIFGRTVRKEGAKKPEILIMNKQQYIESSAPILMQGFFEIELHRSVRSFGAITHVFSTYEARLTPDGPVNRRGVNSIQLFFDQERWWIVSAIWDVERAENPLTPEFLP
jgi:hypothetical protein